MKIVDVAHTADPPGTFMFVMVFFDHLCDFLELDVIVTVDVEVLKHSAGLCRTELDPGRLEELNHFVLVNIA